MPVDVDKFHTQTALLNAYLHSCYTIKAEESEIQIHIGKYNKALNKLAGHTVPLVSWAIITAFNPRSVISSNTENQQQSEYLRQRIEKLHLAYLETCAKADFLKFPPETGYFIKNIDHQSLYRLALDFGQNAVVTGDLLSATRLLVIADVWKSLPLDANLPAFVDIYPPAIENTSLV